MKLRYGGMKDAPSTGRMRQVGSVSGIPYFERSSSVKSLRSREHTNRIVLLRSVSQILMVLSAPPVTMDLPSGEKAPDFTSPLCPTSVLIRCQLLTSHIIPMPSLLVDNSLLPSGENVRSKIAASWP